MTSLENKKCIPCKAEVSPLEGEELAQITSELGNDWRVVNEHHLEKEFNFRDFKEALFFTNQVGELAEREGHHPNIHLLWGKVRIVIWTHTINGLSENDFIFAAKVDQI